MPLCLILGGHYFQSIFVSSNLTTQNANNFASETGGTLLASLHQLTQPDKGKII